MASEDSLSTPSDGNQGTRGHTGTAAVNQVLGCSRRDSNPRYVVEGHESLTGLDYGSTGPVARAPESRPPLMSFRVRGALRRGP